MVNEEIRAQIAVKLLEYWLLSLSFQPTGFFDPDDPACMRDYGPHRVYCVQARVPNGLAVDRCELLDHLRNFLDEQAALPGAMRFNAYDIEMYTSPYCGDYIFVSIYHTA